MSITSPFLPEGDGSLMHELRKGDPDSVSDDCDDESDDQNKRTCLSMMLKDVERCGAQSSVHGWSHGFATNSKYKRCFWFALTFVSLMACIYYIRRRVLDYIQSGVATGFSSSYPPIGGVSIPHVVLCQLNAYDDTMFYKEAIDLHDELLEKLEAAAKKSPEVFHNASKCYIWNQLTGYQVKEQHTAEEAAFKYPTFYEIDASVHQRCFFTKLVGKEIGVEGLLHGEEAITCDTQSAECRDKTLGHYDEKFPPNDPMTDHYLGLLATELIFKFIAAYQLPIWHSLPQLFRDILPYEKAAELSEEGAEFRTRIDQLSWMLQLTNAKDATIHDPDFLSKTLGTNTTYMKKNSIVSDQVFSTYMEAERSIVSVKFDGRLLNPADVFERRTLDISSNCLALKEDMVQKLKQVSTGPLGGLKIILFTGYPGVGVETIYKSLQRKPGLVIILDHPGAGDSFPNTHSPINFRSGSLTRIGIRRTMANLLAKEEVGDKFRGCDAKTRGDEMYTTEKCHQQCFVDVIVESCECIPHYAITTVEYKDSKIPECGFNQLRKPSCWQRLAVRKQSLEGKCQCLSPCTINSYDLSYSITGSNIRGNMDALQQTLDYENQDEKSTDFWKQRLDDSDFPEEDGDDDFDFLKKAINYINMVGKVYAFKNGIDSSEILENPDVLAKGFSVVDIFYEDLNTEVADEYLTDQETSLISDLGGQLGLWIGMSMISIMEILYCACRCCRNRRCV